MGAFTESGNETLPLFNGAGRTGALPFDGTLALIDRDLVVWEGLRRRAEVDPRLSHHRSTVFELGRDLRALRDCCVASHHPRVRRELLREAGTITRRMKSLVARLRLRGCEVVSIV